MVPSPDSMISVFCELPVLPDREDLAERIDQHGLPFAQVAAVGDEEAHRFAFFRGDCQQIGIGIPSGERVVGVAVAHPAVGE